MFISKRTAEPVRKTWKNQPASSLVMSEIGSTFKHINSNNQSDSFDSSSLASTSVRSLSPFPNWRINYKPMPKKIESKGIWGGYQSQDEFLAMHLR